MTVDLNADVGEGYDDEPLFDVVTSVNIACGAHAGDEATMTRVIDAASRRGVAIGAHPSYPDREGFGRRSLVMETPEIRATVLAQIDLLSGIAGSLGARITHMKPHGALYNEAAIDPLLAACLMDCAEARDLVLVGLAGSAMMFEDARGEGFADRAYSPDGTLSSRDLPGALIEDPARAAAQAVALARGEPFTAIDGSTMAVKADTICCHGDTPGAVAIAREVRRALEDAGLEVRAF
ncbi:MAG: LamB/YcsF family protein [Actinomycetota bacterium]|nr:LamB/YcsF family protein [Actinomycetota bacterium]